MPQPPIQLPYFDFLLQEFEKGNPNAEQAFGHHVHWGYWENPATADGTIADFAQAAEHLSQLVCDAGNIQSGMKVLDCGCGFGGTIASLNNRFTQLDLTGLNIDERQLARARQTVVPNPDNQIQFIQGNACKLPFPDQTFDVVTAVECIFHFPSRAEFFREAARVLRPGGRLALSDFISAGTTVSTLPLLPDLIGWIIKQVYGQVRTITLNDYTDLAQHSGFTPQVTRNINAETLPTFEVLDQVTNQSFGPSALFAGIPNKLTEFAQRSGIVLYQVLSYTKD